MDKSQIFLLDSSDRAAGSATNFIIKLEGLDKNANYDACVLLNFFCPKTYYLVKAPWNTFQINENGSLKTITIPEGNYRFKEFPSNLTTIFAAASPALSWTYSFTAVDRTGKLTITVSGNSGVQPIFTFPTYGYGTNPIQRIFGYDSATKTFVGDSLTSDYVCNFQLTNNVAVLSTVVTGDNVLGTVFSSVTDNSVLFYQENDQESHSRSTIIMNTDYMDVKVIDFVTLQPLDLNGGEIALTIKFFKRDTLNRRILEMLTNLYNIGYEEYLIRRREELERKLIESQAEESKSKTPADV